MLNLNMFDFKANYKGKHGNSPCKRCWICVENIEHLSECIHFPSSFWIDKATILARSKISLERISKCMKESLKYAY